MSTKELDRITAHLDVESIEVQDMREKSLQIIDGLANAARKLEEENRVALRRDSFFPEFLNKMGIGEAIEDRIAQKQRFGLFIMDLDNFSGVNTKIGHAGGDAVLKSFGDSLSAAFRRTTDTKAHQAFDAQDEVVTSGRFGGDEFVMIVDLEDNDRRNRNSDERMEAVLARIEVLEATFRNNHAHLAELGIGVSVGEAKFDPAYPVDALTLFEQADAKLYEVKHRVHSTNGVDVTP